MAEESHNAVDGGMLKSCLPQGQCLKVVLLDGGVGDAFAANIKLSKYNIL